MTNSLCRTLVVLLVLALVASGPLQAQESSAAGPLMKLLMSGRLPPERQGNVVKLIAQRGDAADLGYLFEQSLSPEGFAPEVRRVALEGILEAALTRKVEPKGDLSRLRTFLDPTARVDQATRLTVLRLVGALQVESLRGDLSKLVLGQGTPESVRNAALEGLVRLGGDESRQALEQLTAKGQPQALRYQGVAALARFDITAAAERAAEVLSQGTEAEDPAPVVAAFLDIKGGSAKLAAAVARQKVPADVAKLALRHMYAVGRSDVELSTALSKAAGIEANPKPLSKEEIDALVKEVVAKGDPAEGERVFRRADLSCLKCHSLNGAGGDIGPDLRDVGSSSPPDYLLRSILYPDEAIKEEFLTVKIFTSRGLQYHGIVKDENDSRVVLKDATGEQKVIAKKDIDEREKGDSLMPKGLTTFMTHGELVDLVRFLSELGKPGKYAVQSAPVLRRWRLLTGDIPQEEISDDLGFKMKVLDTEATRWVPVYATVSGAVPIENLTALARGQKVVYLQGEIDVKSAGKVGLQINAPAGLALWVEDRPVPVEAKTVVSLTQGRHKVTFRIDTARRPGEPLRVELVPPQDDAAVVVPVGGP